MNDDNHQPIRLPCEDHYATPSLSQELTLGHVVESTSSTGTRVHTDGVETAQSPRTNFSAHQEGYDRDYRTHPNDYYNVAHERTSAFEHEFGDPNTSHGASDEHDETKIAFDIHESSSEHRHILHRDQLERQQRRERERAKRIERRTAGSIRVNSQRRRSALTRSRYLVPRRERTGTRQTAVRQLLSRGHESNNRREECGLSVEHSSLESVNLAHVAAHSEQLERPLTQRLQGVALGAYFVMLPYVVEEKWRASSSFHERTPLRILLVILALFWVGFLVQVIRHIWLLRHGRRAGVGGSAWLAGVIVAVIALFFSSPGATAKPVDAIHVSHAGYTSSVPPLHRTSPSLEGFGVVPLALMAKRRNDILRQGDEQVPEYDVDESIELLRAFDPGVLASVSARVHGRLDGVETVRFDAIHDAPMVEIQPLVACVLESSHEASLIGFAHEGGQLPILPSWSNDDIATNVVALHDGRLTFATSERELLRALATRSLGRHVVVYLGPSNDIDDELAACAITIQPYLALTRNLEFDIRDATTIGGARSGDLRVELLRADPFVHGLSECFTPTLRRRCIEMAAYLALHRHEPITGERLRTRVLTNADVDASQRTLANTASAVRRSFGVDDRGPRLHPVTSSGLYVTHGLTSDVELFSTLVARARQLPVDDAAPLTHQALLLIKGEPLSSALRGFEWFLAEGHGARLARDGEWAALALHHSALGRRNYELAFWALQQGLLIDPYSDAMTEALKRVPRLREFGRNGSSRTKDQPVSSRSAVAMSWSFASLSHHVSQ
jgi:hypothetical protein